MPRYYISLAGGAYALVVEASLHAIESTLANARRHGEFAHFIRPDQAIAAIDPNNVILIQPPVPPNTTPEKE